MCNKANYGSPVHAIPNQVVYELRIPTCERVSKREYEKERGELSSLGVFEGTRADRPECVILPEGLVISVPAENFVHSRATPFTGLITFCNAYAPSKMKAGVAVLRNFFLRRIGA